MNEKKVERKLVYYAPHAAVLGVAIAACALIVQILGIVPSWVMLFRPTESTKQFPQEITEGNRGSVENNLSVVSSVTQNNSQTISVKNSPAVLSLTVTGGEKKRFSGADDNKKTVKPVQAVNQLTKITESRSPTKAQIENPPFTVEKTAKIKLTKVLHKNESVDLNSIDFSVRNIGYTGSGDKNSPLIRLKLPTQKAETIIALVKGWSRTFEYIGRTFTFTLENFDDMNFEISLIEGS